MLLLWLLFISFGKCEMCGKIGQVYRYVDTGNRVHWVCWYHHPDSFDDDNEPNLV